MDVTVNTFGFFGLLLTVVLFALALAALYFVIKAAVGNSKTTIEVYALRRDLNELERRQTERFAVLERHLQEQNRLLREQNEMMRSRENGTADRTGIIGKGGA